LFPNRLSAELPLRSGILRRQCKQILLQFSAVFIRVYKDCEEGGLESTDRVSRREQVVAHLLGFNDGAFCERELHVCVFSVCPTDHAFSEGPAEATSQQAQLHDLRVELLGIGLREQR
jgi:hypothetical protein